MYLRIALVIQRSDETVVRHLLQQSAGEAIHILTVCTSIAEARIRMALIEPDILVVDEQFDMAAKRSILQASRLRNPVLIAWGREDNTPDSPIDSLAIGRLHPTSTEEEVHGILEMCAQHVTEHRLAQMSTLRHPEAAYRSDLIALPHQHGIEVRRADTVIHIRGEGNYTRVTFERGGELIMSRTIGDYEDVLPAETFVRIHRSHIVNIHHVRKIIRGKVMRAQLSNGVEVEVADGKRDMLLALVNVVRRR
ncbi:MAG: hypothetical protein RL594_837 [Bacteroidota bacterium]|jgi:DNA-binding LytR/AlgR family response regulator